MCGISGKPQFDGAEVDRELIVRASPGVESAYE
jgi:hypothetical protein